MSFRWGRPGLRQEQAGEDQDDDELHAQTLFRLVLREDQMFDSGGLNSRFYPLPQSFKGYDGSYFLNTFLTLKS